MKLLEFVTSLNEEQLNFLLEHFYVSYADTHVGMQHDHHCQRGQLKDAVIKQLKELSGK